MIGVVLLVAVLACATAFGLWRQRTDGRMRHVQHGDTSDAVGVSGGRRDLGLDDAQGPGVGEVTAPADSGADIAGTQALTAGDVGEPLGERATLVQFSSAFCQPCRVTRVVLADVARTVPGVTHVEIDAESRLDLVRRVDVTRTPTVLVLDAAGRIRTRATGAPRAGDVLGALGAIL